MVVHFGSTFLAMNTPAISEFVPAAPGPAPSDFRPAPREPRVRTPRRVTAPRAAEPVARLAPPRRSPAREILAGVLLLVAWALLWSFFLAGVVEPGAALHREARASAAAARWIEP